MPLLRFNLLGEVYYCILICLLGICCNSEKADERFQFKIDRTDQIHSIVLTHVQGEQIRLIREGDRWLLNGGYYARQNAIENLLDAMSRVELQSIPVQAAREAMMADLKLQGIQVQAFDQQGGELISYTVGGMTPDERGTYMLKKGSDLPAVTSIPGWEGGLRIRYWMAPIDWQDRTVFRITISEFQEAAIRYYHQPSSSFRLTREQDKYVCRDFAGESTPFTVSSAAAYRYIQGFQHVGAEAVIAQQDAEGFVSSEAPWCELHVHTSADTLQYFVYPLETAPTARGSIKRHHFVSGDGDIFLVQDALVNELFLGYDYFQDHQLD